jgi:hypothetical protein
VEELQVGDTVLLKAGMKLWRDKESAVVTLISDKPCVIEKASFIDEKWTLEARCLQNMRVPRLDYFVYRFGNDTEGVEKTGHITLSDAMAARDGFANLVNMIKMKDGTLTEGVNLVDDKKPAVDSAAILKKVAAKKAPAAKKKVAKK